MTFGTVITPSPELDPHLARRYSPGARQARANGRRIHEASYASYWQGTAGRYHRNGSGNGCGFDATIIEDALVIEWHDGTDTTPNAKVAVPFGDLTAALGAERVGDGELVAALRTFPAPGVDGAVAVVRERCTVDLSDRSRTEHHGRMLVITADPSGPRRPDRIAVLDLHLVVDELDVSSATNAWRPELWGQWIGGLAGAVAG